MRCEHYLVLPIVRSQIFSVSLYSTFHVYLHPGLNKVVQIEIEFSQRVDILYQSDLPFDMI